MDTDYYYNSLDDKHKRLVRAFDPFFTSLNSPQKEARLSSTKAVFDNANALSEQLAPADRPQWLTALIQACNLYIEKTNKNQSVTSELRLIIGSEKSATDHSWEAARSNLSPLLDFDEILERHRNNEVVNLLFDQLIESLEKIIDSDELDSRRATEDLERLIATLKKSKKGTFQAQVFSFDFAKGWVKNFAIEWVKDTKVAKVAHAAATKTVDELDITFDEARQEIQAVIDSARDHVKERMEKAVLHDNRRPEITSTENWPATTLTFLPDQLNDRTESSSSGTAIASEIALLEQE